MAEELQWESPLLDNPEAIARLLREQNRPKNVETFQILLLNTRRRLIRVDETSQGTLDTLLVHAREVFNSAIAARAAAIVLVHNHPSGDPTPSEADIFGYTFFLLGTPVLADIPRPIDFQGSLSDSRGRPINGQHDLTFTIYAAPTNCRPL